MFVRHDTSVMYSLVRTTGVLPESVLGFATPSCTSVFATKWARWKRAMRGNHPDRGEKSSVVIVGGCRTEGVE